MKRKIKILILLGLSLSAGPGRAAALELEWINLIDSSVKPGFRINSHPRLSQDGRFVVFESREPGHTEQRTKPKYVYMYDRDQRVFKKVDPGGSFPRANGATSISDNSRYTAYHSYPLDPSSNYSPRISEIYVYDRLLNTSFFQAFGKGDLPVEGENLAPVLNSDGRYIVFSSNSSNFTADKNPSVRVIYGFDRQFNTLEVISRNPMTGEQANRPSSDPRISQNGRYVAYKSAATNLIELSSASALSVNLYFFDRRDRHLIQVNTSTHGFNNDKLIVARYDMDGGGHSLVFEARPRKLIDPMGILEETDLFMFNRSSATITHLTQGLFAKRSHSPTLSGDGRYVGFVFKGTTDKKTEGGLIVYDTKQDIWRHVLRSGNCYNPSFSRDGRFLAFESDQKDLIVGAPDEIRQVYVVKNPFID